MSESVLPNKLLGSICEGLASYAFHQGKFISGALLLLLANATRWEQSQKAPAGLISGEGHQGCDSCLPEASWVLTWLFWDHALIRLQKVLFHTNLRIWTFLHWNKQGVCSGDRHLIKNVKTAHKNDIQIIHMYIWERTIRLLHKCYIFFMIPCNAIYKTIIIFLIFQYWIFRWFLFLSKIYLKYKNIAIDTRYKS